MLRNFAVSQFDCVHSLSLFLVHPASACFAGRRYFAVATTAFAASPEDVVIALASNMAAFSLPAVVTM
jgi:hypothetical protein